MLRNRYSSISYNFSRFSPNSNEWGKNNDSVFSSRINFSNGENVSLIGVEGIGQSCDFLFLNHNLIKQRFYRILRNLFCF